VAENPCSRKTARAASRIWLSVMVVVLAMGLW
jgi:hypothetical protein